MDKSIAAVNTVVLSENLPKWQSGGKCHIATGYRYYFLSEVAHFSKDIA